MVTFFSPVSAVPLLKVPTGDGSHVKRLPHVRQPQHVVYERGSARTAADGRWRCLGWRAGVDGDGDVRLRIGSRVRPRPTGARARRRNLDYAFVPSGAQRRFTLYEVVVLEVVKFEILHVLVGEVVLVWVMVWRVLRWLRWQGLHFARVGAIAMRVLHHGAVRGARRPG